MRKQLAVLFLVLVAGASVLAQSPVTPESRLALGMAAYKAADFASAVVDLQAAAQGFLSPEQVQSYVNTGKFEPLQSFETALVYLALSQMRLGRDDDARETLMRLHSAERIAPTYATLPLAPPEASEMQSLAAALTPSNPLPPNMAVKKAPGEERAERQQIIDEMAGAKREPDVRVATSRREDLLDLRAAETAASTGRIDEAVRIYTGLANSPSVPREVLAEAAVGLYRTGAFREAAQAFRKFGTFAKGEEDLRYYYAVALYETGSYAGAQKELSCALPFLQVTEDVTRYRSKIENTVAQTASK